MIGVLDSGVGGLTVVRQLMAQLPGYDMFYWADTRATVDDWSLDAGKQWAETNLARLVNAGARLVVVTCHSMATALSGATWPPDTAVIDPIDAGVQAALQASRRGAIGVVGSRMVVESGVYSGRIRQVCPAARVYAVACPLLVHLAQDGRWQKPETAMIAKKYLLPLKSRQVDTLIPASSHFAPLEKLLQQKMGRRVALIDPGAVLAHRVKAYLETHPELGQTLPGNGTLTVAVSDATAHLQAAAQRFFGKNLYLSPMPAPVFP
jgi:glutamate racemase